MKRFLIITSVLSLTAIVSFVTYFLGSEEEAIIRASACGFLTLLTVGGTTYLAIHFKSISH